MTTKSLTQTKKTKTKTKMIRCCYCGNTYDVAARARCPKCGVRDDAVGLRLRLRCAFQRFVRWFF